MDGAVPIPVVVREIVDLNDGKNPQPTAYCDYRVQATGYREHNVRETPGDGCCEKWRRVRCECTDSSRLAYRKAKPSACGDLEPIRRVCVQFDHAGNNRVVMPAQKRVVPLCDTRKLRSTNVAGETHFTTDVDRRRHTGSDKDYGTKTGSAESRTKIGQIAVARSLCGRSQSRSNSDL